MRSLILLALLIATKPAIAMESMLYGSWQSDEDATVAVYGKLRISGTNITWGGLNRSHPRCISDYVMAPDAVGTTFTDKSGATFQTGPNSKFDTYLLKIKAGSNCAGAVSAVRLTFPASFDPNELVLVAYGKSGKAQEWVHFQRYFGKAH